MSSWVRSLLGGMTGRRNGTASTLTGASCSTAATPSGSQPTLPEIDAMASVVQLEEMTRQNRHAMSMGQAQLRQHLGENWQEPDEVGINWNSPTTVNYGQRGGIGTLAKLAVGAALLGSGLGLGSAIPWLIGKLAAGAAPVVAPSHDADTQYRLGLGEPDG